MDHRGVACNICLMSFNTCQVTCHFGRFDTTLTVQFRSATCVDDALMRFNQNSARSTSPSQGCHGDAMGMRLQDLQKKLTTLAKVIPSGWFCTLYFVRILLSTSAPFVHMQKSGHCRSSHWPCNSNDSSSGSSAWCETLQSWKINFNISSFGFNERSQGKSSWNRCWNRIASLIGPS